MKKKRYLLVALALGLALTAGMFVYTFTTAGATLGTAAITTDWATVATNAGASSVTWTPLGRYIGRVPADSALFDVTPKAPYTGTLEVRVYLTNAEDLVQCYRYLHMKLKLEDAAGGAATEVVDDQGMAGGKAYQILNLRNGEVTFLLSPTKYVADTTYYVNLDGGSYMTHPFTWFTADTQKPELWCEVTQAGL